MNNYKSKVSFFLALVSLFVVLSLIQETYAKYVTNANANTNMTIARWNILVNNQDIISKSDFSDTIIPVFSGDDYTASGIIAPNSEGYFDIVIDHSKVDVSFNETITLSLGDNNTISDLKITGYSLNNGIINSFSSSTIINNTIPLNPVTTTQTFRIYVKWIDGEGETMNNQSDTNATVNGVASIKVSVGFIQIAN